MLLAPWNCVCRQTESISLIQLLQKRLKNRRNTLKLRANRNTSDIPSLFEGAFIQCCANPYITRQYTEIEDLFYLTVLYDHWYIDTVRFWL